MNIETHPFLQDGDFHDWAVKFDATVQDYVKTFMHSQIDLNVSFSNEKKQVEYGDKTVGDVKDIILSKCPNADVLDIFEKIHTKSDFVKFIETLAARIAQSQEGYSFDDAYGMLRKEIEEIAFAEDVLGEYSQFDKRIILYSRSIEKRATDPADAKRLYEEVLSTN